MHVPPLHVPVQCGPVPQWHVPPMHDSPPVQAGVQSVLQLPITQAMPVVHGWSHMPQCVALVIVFVHIPPQHMLPPAQCAVPQ